mmetsp:Transcript_30885/g.75998  ORF Transcript_30885/g.75998 Transcript_30885/m.75998 type:complete len:212 (+) Transcript_30885:119-754(+)
MQHTCGRTRPQPLALRNLRFDNSAPPKPRSLSTRSDSSRPDRVERVGAQLAALAAGSLGLGRVLLLQPLVLFPVAPLLARPPLRLLPLHLLAPALLRLLQLLAQPRGGLGVRLLLRLALALLVLRHGMLDDRLQQPQRHRGEQVRGAGRRRCARRVEQEREQPLRARVGQHFLLPRLLEGAVHPRVPGGVHEAGDLLVQLAAKDGRRDGRR